MKCLWWQRPAGSCNRLGHPHSGGSPSQSPWRQELACGEIVCSGSSTACTPLSNGVSFPKQTTLPLGAFPAVEPLTHVPSGCLYAANSGPLPGSALLTPCFSNQPLPALVDSHLWLWHPGLIPDEALAWAVHASPPGSIQPKEALAVAVLRTPGPAWVEEALASGMDEPAQMGAPLSAHKGRGR